jgi:serine/threonine protein kinase
MAVRTTLAKLLSRLRSGCGSCCCRSPSVTYSLLPRTPTPIEMMGLNNLSSEVDVARVGSSELEAAKDECSYCQIDERDLVRSHIVGKGAYGEVWSGLLNPEGRAVAIKIIRHGALVDDDGDLIHPEADAEFRKECAALQRFRSPHLVEFIGFGASAGSHQFIVTELMALGSLENALHDPERDLPWRTRVAIGLQVALGMDHLHQRHMLHRDLKSANVLLDENFKAKVCDFGLMRMSRPAHHRVARSSFTGTTRVLPDASGLEMSFQRDATTAFSMSGAACGTDVGALSDGMTKAPGTVLWMAPEVFRGDEFYGPKVDVYSFGIVMWELATRLPPWSELSRNEVTFVEQLNDALRRGQRPVIPSEVSTKFPRFVAVMRSCWAGDPADRPTFSAAGSELAACLCELGAVVVVEKYEGRVRSNTPDL